MSELRVARIGRDDLPGVVAIHVKAFPDSAISAFGPEAIRRYYLWLVEGPHEAAVMGAWREARLIGFCAAGVFHGAMNGFLRAHRGYLARHLLQHPSLLASALIRDRLRTALSITMRFSRRRQRKAAASGTAPAPRFGVLSIATDPDVRGAGAGRALMLDAEARARSLGHTRMVLTVHPENTRAVQFYEQLGWSRSPGTGAWGGAMHRDL
jgi:ribosomal protein S18 acetylase RimI-like enzyme